MRDRLREQGFTLMEVMITVAIIAILAAIAVPVFTKQSRKSKASSEANAVFAELSVREEQYKLENGAYLTAAACPAVSSISATLRMRPAASPAASRGPPCACASPRRTCTAATRSPRARRPARTIRAGSRSLARAAVVLHPRDVRDGRRDVGPQHVLHEQRRLDDPVPERRQVTRWTPWGSASPRSMSTKA